MAQLSAALIIYNEDAYIEEAILQLDFADEIVVVDSFSTDGTLDILKKFPHVKVVQHTFKDYASQRNFAIAQTQYPWILFIDADERIPRDLKTEIQQVLVSNPKPVAYKFRRQFIYNNKPLRFSGLQTDAVFRLFKKGFAFYKPDRLVHEQLIVDGDIGVLKTKLLHYFFESYEVYKKKMVDYGKLRGKELYLKGKRPNIFQQYIKPFYKFITHYIIRLGILDGKKGWHISYLNALSVAERYREANRLFRSSPEK